MQNGTHHVGIIGGGIVGICTALALQEAGQRVTLIDRDAPGQAASFGNAGIISPWSIVPQAMPGIWKQIPGMLLRADGPAGVSLRHGPGYLPWLTRFLKESRPAKVQANSDAMQLLCADSISLYQHLLAGTGHEDLITHSMYVHAFRDMTEADPQALGFRMRTQKGAEIERIGADELHRLEPALSREFQAAILIKGQARARNPGRMATVLADKLAQQGGTILRTSVTGLTPTQDGWRVSSEAGPQTFDKVVVAAGAWSQKLLSPLGIKLPLAAERGYHIAFPDTDLHLNNSVMDVAAHVVASSMEGGLRVAGIAEFAGLNTPPNPRRLKAIKRVAIQMIPDLAGQTHNSWMGIRPSFPDSLPVIEELSQHPGLICAFGHSHYGLMMAPKTGRLVAQMATGTVPNTDLSALRSARF